jgi:hypothetical protein
MKLFFTLALAVVGISCAYSLDINWNDVGNNIMKSIPKMIEEAKEGKSPIVQMQNTLGMITNEIPAANAQKESERAKRSMKQIQNNLTKIKDDMARKAQNAEDNKRRKY